MNHIKLIQLKELSKVFLPSENINEALTILKNSIESGKILLIEDPKETPVKKIGTFNLTKNKDDSSNTGNTSGSNTTTEQSQNAYAAPGIFTYNDSDTYELGTAIPTSNEYKNGVILDGWYGNVEISQNTYARTEKTSNSHEKVNTPFPDVCHDAGNRFRGAGRCEKPLHAYLRLPRFHRAFRIPRLQGGTDLRKPL